MAPIENMLRILIKLIILSCIIQFSNVVQLIIYWKTDGNDVILTDSTLLVPLYFYTYIKSVLREMLQQRVIHL